MPAKKTATKKKATKKPGTGKGKKAKATAKGQMSALDAAAQVLAEAKGPLSTKELIEQMAQKGYWKSPAGKTPARTLYSAITRELQTKGKDARFKKAKHGRFGPAH